MLDGLLALLVPALILGADPASTDPRAADEPPAERESAETSPAAREEVREEITVSAGVPSGSLAPRSASAASLRVEETGAEPATLAELAASTAAVSENGQGGLFQVLSVRGISGQRVQVRLDGMRLTSERRAGVSASFLDPQLLSAVDVLRGPSSAFYGSGALGGLVQAFPARDDRLSVRLGYEDQGDASHLRLGCGASDGAWSLGLAYRRAGNAEAADGSELASAFSQVSAVLSGRWGWAGRDVELQVIPTYGDDIGKASTDFPDRNVVYPRERHLLAKLSVAAPSGRSFFVYAHPQDLLTRTVEAGERSLVENRGLDLGGSLRLPWSRGAFEGEVGLEYFGRRGVDAVETVDTLETAEAPGPAGPGVPEVSRTLDGASVDEAGAYASARRSLGRASLEAGLRASWLRQANTLPDSGTDRATESLDDGAWSGFAGLVLPLGSGFEAVANAGTGLRFPSLSERFFTGTTGRGTVIGNRDLEPERSRSFDLGLRRFSGRSYLGLFLFSTRIEDYVERVEVEPGVRAFVNLEAGTIEGVELEGFRDLGRRWRLSWGGHWMEAEDADGLPLADVPADRVQAGAELRLPRWSLRALAQHRFSKDDPGSGEKAIGSANLLSAVVRFALRDGLALTATAENLLDERYFKSADEQVPLAEGRSIGLGLSWKAGGA